MSLRPSGVFVTSMPRWASVSDRVGHCRVSPDGAALAHALVTAGIGARRGLDVADLDVGHLGGGGPQVIRLSALKRGACLLIAER